MLGIAMNLLGIHSLLEYVFECPLKEPCNLEDNFLINPSIPFDHEGWQLCIEESLVDENALKCLKSLVKKYNLKIDDKLEKGYYVLDSK
jgi:hypothetical protein